MSPEEVLAMRFWKGGQLEGHTHRDVLRFAQFMGELADLDRLERVAPTNVISPDVVEGGCGPGCAAVWAAHEVWCSRLAPQPQAFSG
jgi:hypothetical protein